MLRPFFGLFPHVTSLSLIVCQSWLWADLGLPTVRSCSVSVLTGIELGNWWTDFITDFSTGHCLFIVWPVVYVTVSVLSKGISQLILLLTLCACWALADRPTASLFIYTKYSTGKRRESDVV